jgi:hypothetical protein
MKRLLALWLVLVVAFQSATALTAWFLFHHIDLTFQAFFMLAIIPPVQALAIAWVLAPDGAAPLAAACRRAAREPMVGPVLALDGVMVVGGWLLFSHQWIGLAGQPSLQLSWVAIKAVAGGLCLITAGFRASWSGPAGHRQGTGQAWLILAGMMIALAGVNEWYPWLSHLPSLLSIGRADQPTIVIWGEVYGPLFVIGLTIALKASGAVARLRPAIAPLWEAALALTCAAALFIVMNLFLRRTPIDPYRSLAITGGSLAATLFLLCGMLLVDPVEHQAAPAMHRLSGGADAASRPLDEPDQRLHLQARR